MLDVNETCKFIKQKLGSYYSPKKVRQQVDDFHFNQGLSYEDICARVSYWYDVKHGDPAKSAGGIAIITYIEKDFLEWQEKQSNLNKVKKNLENFTLDNEPPQIIYVKPNREYKLPTSN